MSLVLASGSPRRTELLTRAGIAHEVRASAAEEERFAACWAARGAEELALRLALLKAYEVARRSEGDALVLGADTVCRFGGAILGKPRDDAEARRMLEAMMGTRHEVLTGVVLIDLRDGRARSAVEVSVVKLAPWDAARVDDYVAAGLSRGKAGAYGIQDPLIAGAVEEVEGCVDNVIGLPLARVRGLLEEVGWRA